MIHLSTVLINDVNIEDQEFNYNHVLSLKQTSSRERLGASSQIR